MIQEKKSSIFINKIAELWMWIAVIVAMCIYGLPELKERYSIFNKETFISIDDKFVNYYYKGELVIMLNKKECKYLLIKEKSRLVYNCGEGVQILEEGDIIKE